MNFSDSAFTEWLTDALSCLTSEGSAIYCCGPITSGKAAFEWLVANELHSTSFDDLLPTVRQQFTKEVISRNLEALRSVAERLRVERRCSVINPAGVPPITGWSQGQWRGFWCAVIERYAFEVVMLPGWEYSTGAAGEFACALRLGRRITKTDGAELTAEEGRRLICDALQSMNAAGFATNELREIAAALDCFTDQVA